MNNISIVGTVAVVAVAVVVTVVAVATVAVAVAVVGGCCWWVEFSYWLLLLLL